MRYFDFRTKLEGLPVFNLTDIRKIDSGFHNPQLTYWQEKGWVRPIAGGYYVFGDTQITPVLLNIVANKIVQPSYVSLESSLAYYQIIPERVYGVTSVTSKKTSRFESDWGFFSYRSLKPSLMFGYDVARTDWGGAFLIASLEKTVLDYLYLNSHIDSFEDFEELRWEQESLMMLRHNALFDSMLERFNKKALNYRVDQLMRYLNA
jgi:predicted transcriptional regulator of viral defense system